MLKIDKIVVHNSGGLANDPMFSSQSLTESHIENAHKSRWPDFPSELNGKYTGYNVSIFPDGTWKQYRYLGEETAAVKGHNLDSFHIHLYGNFTKGVDSPTVKQIGTLVTLMKSLLNGTAEYIGIQVKKGTTYEFTKDRIYPHRLLSPVGYTQCYGNSLSDDWARSLVMTTAKIQLDDTTKVALGIIDQIIVLLTKIKRLFIAEDVNYGYSYGNNDRDDEAVLTEDIMLS